MVLWNSYCRRQAEIIKWHEEMEDRDRPLPDQPKGVRSAGKWDAGNGWVKHVTVWVDGMTSTYWTFDEFYALPGNFSPELDDGSPPYLS